MRKESRIVLVYVLGNFIPLIQILTLISIWFIEVSIACKIAIAIFWTFLVPPLLARLSFAIQGKPTGEFAEDSPEFRQWYFISQLQVIYMRFTFLEEFLRALPTVYNFWLRLWGAEIGSMVYWSPKTTVMDRPYLKIGRRVLIGYAAGFSSHHINRSQEKVSILIASPIVEDFAILGGLSGLSPGAVLATGETLPSTFGLAPFYIWKNGRKYSLKSMPSHD